MSEITQLQPRRRLTIRRRQLATVTSLDAVRARKRELEVQERRAKVEKVAAKVRAYLDEAIALADELGWTEDELDAFVCAVEQDRPLPEFAAPTAGVSEAG